MILTIIKFQRFLGWLVSTLLLIVFSFVTSPEEAPAEVNANLPTRILQVGEGNSSVNALIPEWRQISFGSMPPISSSGSAAQGHWTAGQTPDQFLTLGDISPALSVELLSVGAIANLARLNSSQIALSSFPLVGEQTLNQLVEAVPELGQFNVSTVSTVASLLSAKGVGGSGNQPLATVLAQSPQIRDTKLNEIDLSQFPLSSIPNLSATDLRQFAGWQNSLMSDVPGLSSLPLTEFPNPIATLGNVVMRIDAIYGTAESDRSNTISGSDVAGFNVSCGNNCAYVELDDLENVGRRVRGSAEGFQWISGKYQQVEGGWGCLKGVNGGKEPTGRMPFGNAFKVVVMEPDERTDTVDTALYFRFSTFCGATPYFIGPVPFFSYRVNSPIFVGLLDNNAVDSLRPNFSGLAQSNATNGALSAERVGGESGVVPRAGVPTVASRAPGLIQGVDLDILAESISGMESGGDYGSIGSYVCADSSRNCGRALGKYQYMSYNDAARELILAKPGGAEFLVKLNNGYQPTDSELFQYFPPADQDLAFKQDLANKLAVTSTEIDPTTRQPFTGSRLLERVAQKHFGGDYSKVDGGGTDVFGRLSIKSYGSEVRQRYLASGGASPRT